MSARPVPVDGDAYGGEAAPPPVSRWRTEWTRVAPFLVVLALFVVASLAPGLFANFEPGAQDLQARLEPPGSAAGELHLLGTDQLGRDVYSRIVYGARVSLFIAVTAVLISGTVGGVLGIVGGFYKNAVGTVVMRLADIVLSIPFLLLAIMAVVVLGTGLLNLIVVLGLVRWPRYARVAYGKTLETVNQDFVRAAEALGAKPRRLILRHIVPEVIPPLVVVATLEVGLMIIFEASLSFLGLGVQPPNPSWGGMLSEGQQYVALAWWLATFPGIAIVLVVLSVNLVGDFVRDMLDPKGQTLR